MQSSKSDQASDIHDGKSQVNETISVDKSKENTNSEGAEGESVVKYSRSADSEDLDDAHDDSNA